VALSGGGRGGEQIAQIEALLEHSRKMLDDADRMLALLEAEQGRVRPMAPPRNDAIADAGIRTRVAPIWRNP